MLKFSANLTIMFNEVDFLDRFAAAAKAGFNAVEFLLPYPYDKSELAGFLRTNKLLVVLFNMPAGDWNAGDRGMACDPARVSEFQEGVGKAIDYAHALGCKQIHCMAGLKPRGVSEEKMRATYIANLQFAGRELSKHGLKLLIEAINTRDMPDFYLNTSRQAFSIMDDAKVPNLYFQYDIYHMQVMEGDLAPTIEKNLAKIGHMQLADTPGRHEPGTGEINYAFLFRHIERIGYEGWIGCEYRPATTTEAGLGWIKPYLK
jgi:hydroxypyruvate isomerase